MREKKDVFKGFCRRRYTRIPFSFPVRFIFCGYDKDDLQEEGSYNYAFSKDISAGGVQLTLKEKPKIAKYVKLKLTLPFQDETKALEVVGNILWAKPDESNGHFNVGVEFSELFFEDKKVIKAFIEQTMKGMHY